MTPGSHSVLRCNNSMGVILSGEGVILYWDGMTPGLSFCLGMEILKGSLSIPGQKVSGGFNLLWDRTTLGESF